MLKFLVIQLDDTATSFCFYENRCDAHKLISIADLKAGLFWAMKENLMVQFVYPNYELPQEYYAIIDKVDHSDIVANDIDADVTVYSGIEGLNLAEETIDVPSILRLSKSQFGSNIDRIAQLSQVNIVITDIASIREDEIPVYKECLNKLANAIHDRVTQGISSHTNLLTDRMQLSTMNNCNAGDESITLAPDGKFYICPAFYFDGETPIGDPYVGLSIPNSHLFKLEYAPICKTCDAFHCRRCVWLNKKKTREVNTPSREQCIAAHLERNASRDLLENLRREKLIKADITIPEVDYLDPFEKIKR